MASAAAALMTASTRRLSPSTASTMVLREVSGSHKLTINGCKPSKNFLKGWSWESKPFRVGSHSWRIRYFPHGHEKGDHISLLLELDRSSAIDTACDVKFMFSVLDQSGNPVPKFTRAMTKPCSFQGFSSCHGFRDSIRWEDLEESGCIKDDTFTVQCDLTFTTDLGSTTTANDDAAPAIAVAAAAALAPAPAPPKMHERLAYLLWKHKHGADVIVDVGSEEAFDAHGWVLAERSPVFKEITKSAGAGAHQRIEIEGVESKVLEAVLQYMYTDTLPEIMDDAMAMAPGLLAAADRFKIEGLKLLCEETLSKRIDVGTAAGILAVAEQHGCKALKAACLEFMSRQENLKAVMETEGYEKARAIVQPLVIDLAVKQYLLIGGHK